MKLCELFDNIILKEAVTRVHHPMYGEVLVLVNPPRNAILHTLKKSKYNQLKFLEEYGEFYFWDAQKFTHADMAKKLGLEYQSGSGDDGSISIFQDNILISCNEETLNSSFFKNRFNISYNEDNNHWELT